jgi:hypothetical protein
MEEDEIVEIKKVPADEPRYTVGSISLLTAAFVLLLAFVLWTGITAGQKQRAAQVESQSPAVMQPQ